MNMMMNRWRGGAGRGSGGGGGVGGIAQRGQGREAGNSARGEAGAVAVLLVGAAALLLTSAALNGGVAPAASGWDALKTWATDLLTSTFVVMLALFALIASIWQITHGRGYAYLGVVLGVLAVGLLGPPLVTTIATSTRAPTALVVNHSVPAARH